MKATRASTIAVIDGATIGSVTETPPEDPPPRVNPRHNPDSLARLIAHILIALVHLLAVMAHVAGN